MHFMMYFIDKTQNTAFYYRIETYHIIASTITPHRLNNFNSKDFNNYPFVTDICIPRVSSVKTQPIYCQLNWRHVSAQGVIIRPITESCMRYIKWKCTFLGSQNVYSSDRTWVQIRLICNTVNINLIVSTFSHCCIYFYFLLWRCGTTRVMTSSFLRFSRSHTTTHHIR
jgi:hypothetical protein